MAAAARTCQSFGVEALEPRNLFAVDVTFSSGLLTILGDSLNNRIEVGFVEVSGTKYLIVECDDVVVLDGTAGPGIQTSATLSITVSLGDGNDEIDLAAVTTANGFAGLGGAILLDGGAGNDTLQGSAFADMVDGGAGDDLVVGWAGNDTMLGGLGGDIILGNDGDDSLEGGSGNDVYWYGGTAQGNDRIVEDTGADFDLVTFGDYESGVALDLGLTNQQAVGGDTAVTVVNEGSLDGVIGSAFDDTLSGGASSEYLIGGAGDDLLAGGAGADFYVFDAGDNGSDTVVELASGGKDWLVFSGADVPVTFCLACTGPLSWGGGAITSTNPEEMENAVGSAFGDFFCGNGADNILVGDDGDDILVGRAGNDALIAGAGQDVLIGSGGRDLVVGGVGIDALIGDEDDDLVVGAEWAPPGVSSYAEIQSVIDAVLGAWGAASPHAQRVANVTGAEGALDPIAPAYQLRAGETVLDDGLVDLFLMTAGAGDDLVFWNSRDDSLITDDVALATYRDISGLPEIEATFENGLLTISYYGSGSLVLGVADGNVLVNGAGPLATPLAAADVNRMELHTGQAAGAIDTSAVVEANFPNLGFWVFARTDPETMPALTVADIEAFLAGYLGSDWETLVGASAASILEAYNAGQYGILYELLCGAMLQAGAGAVPWYNVADDIGGGGGGGEILSEGSQSSSANAQEGGTLSIESSDPVDEGGYASFRLILDAHYFNGFSVRIRTVNGSATGGTEFCNGDYLSRDYVMEWYDGGEFAIKDISIHAFDDYRVESDETFDVELSDLQNYDGQEGNVTLGNATGTATIHDTTELPVASVGNAVAVEGLTLYVPVSLSHAMQDPVTVNWTAADITADGSDYSPSSGSITFDPLTCSFPGETQKYIEISTALDGELEPTETFEVRLTGGTHVVLSTLLFVGQGRIINPDMVAHRPITEGNDYGEPFLKRAVPDEEEIDPGVFIRRNGDNDNGINGADWLEVAEPVANEDDLIEVNLKLSDGPPAGTVWKAKATTEDLRLWRFPDKGGGFYGTEMTFTTNVEVPGPSMAVVWVEWVTPGTGPATSTLQFFIQKDDNSDPVLIEEITFHPFTSVVIVLGGENHHPTDPAHPNHGTFQSAIDLYEEGYDVHMYDENKVEYDGSGVAFEEVKSAVANRGVQKVVIIGYSHGGGGAFLLSERLEDERAQIPYFDIVMTAYIDAVKSGPLNASQEIRYPRGTAYLLNIYQENNEVELGGGPIVPPISGELETLNVTQTDWGVELTHFNIDEANNVRELVKSRVRDRIGNPK